jgi:hypothetical protein
MSLTTRTIMTISNYSTGAHIGISISIDEDAYNAYLANDNSGTGAVRAGDWLSDEELEEFGIDADLTIFAE